MDHRNHLALASSEITQANLTGAPIYGRDDDKIGTIAEVHGSGAAAEIVISVGGYLGIGAKHVRLGVDQLSLMRDENGVVHGVTTWNREEIADLPRHIG